MPDLNTRNVTKHKDKIGTAMVTVTTTAALTAVGNAINTVGKYKGKMVYNDTTGIILAAGGPLAADPWKLCSTGANTHLPV